MEQILKPLASLIGGYTICKTREEAKKFSTEKCYPIGYTVDKPIQGHMHGIAMDAIDKLYPFAPRPEMMELVSKNLGGKRPITITIRQSPIKPGRNSQIEEWKKAAHWMVDQGWWPLFIPDTDGQQDFSPFDTYARAAVNVEERLALMGLSMLNLGVNNGPMEFIFWSRIPGLIFRYQDEKFIECSAAWHAKQKLPVNSQPVWFTDQQRIVWKDDTEANITEAVKTWFAVRAGVGKWDPHLIPPLPLKSVVKDGKRQEQMNTAMQKMKEYGFEKFTHSPQLDMGKAMTICAYGPSLADHIDEIRKSPRPILTVSGAHDLLIEHGIVPDFHVDCDPRPHKARFTSKPHKDVTYLMASCVHEKNWENLKGHKVKVWHLDNGDSTLDWLKANDPDSYAIAGGSNVGLRAFEIGMLLGYGRFEVFGLDCSFKKDGEKVQQWAGGHDTQPHRTITVKTEDGEEFHTSNVMIEAAREFREMKFKRGIQANVHGHGLLQKMLTMTVEKLKAA